MPTVVHRYLQNCHSNKQPPGFADFLRGTQTLFLTAPFFSYDVKVDYSSHPVFLFLEHQTEYDGSDFTSLDSIECIPPRSYDLLKQQLLELFQTGKDFAILTNSFPIDQLQTPSTTLFAKQSLQKILQPSQEIRSSIQSLKHNLMNTSPYAIFHIRMGDQYIGQDKVIPENLLLQVLNKIKEVQAHASQSIPLQNLLVLTDSFALKKHLLQNNIPTTEGIPVHLGEVSTTGTIDMVRQTMIDFFLLRFAHCIYAMSPTYGGASGFSRIVHTIFDVPFLEVLI